MIIENNLKYVVSILFVVFFILFTRFLSGTLMMVEIERGNKQFTLHMRTAHRLEQIFYYIFFSRF